MLHPVTSLETPRLDVPSLRFRALEMLPRWTSMAITWFDYLRRNCLIWLLLGRLDNVAVTNCPAIGRRGVVNILHMLLDLIMCLVSTMVMWLVTRRIMPTRRATSITATLNLLPICPSKVSILAAALGLSVSAVLLVSRTLGPAVSVWVTLMCRPRLLDSREGHPPVRLSRFMNLRSLPI